MIFGELDRRVELHNVTITPNNYGELTRTYIELRVVWAAIDWKGGTEKLDDSNKITGMTKLHVYIRNLDLSTFTLQSKIVYEGKDYFPLVINQIDGRKEFLEIICEFKD